MSAKRRAPAARALALFFCCLAAVVANAANEPTLPAPAPPPATEFGADDVIKLGFVTDLSGPMKDSVGDVYFGGAQFAVDEINDDGGLLGRRLEIIPIDCAWRSDVAIKNIKKAMREHGIRFFGCDVSSQTGHALIKVMEENKAVWYSCTMAAADLTGQAASRYFFRCNHNTDVLSKAMAAEVVKRGFKKVFVIAQDYELGQQASDAFIKNLQEMDRTAEIVGPVLHPLENKDFTPYVSQLIDSGAQVAFTSNYASDLTLLVSTAHRMGFKGKFASYYLNASFYTRALGDDAAAGHFSSDSYMMSIPTQANEEFVQRFHAKKGFYPEMRGKAYIATMFWAEAVKKAGSTDVEKVIEAWEGLSYDGPAGRWTMRAFDHQTLLPIWTADIVRDNPYYNCAYPDKATMLSAEDTAIPVEQTGAPGFGSR
jgi:branched-chain amino acid transport system substrate-binding protein